jgi:hypothetical protein
MWLGNDETGQTLLHQRFGDSACEVWQPSGAERLVRQKVRGALGDALELGNDDLLWPRASGSYARH